MLKSYTSIKVTTKLMSFPKNTDMQMKGGQSSPGSTSGQFRRKRHHLSFWSSPDIFRAQAEIPLCGGNGEAKDNKNQFYWKSH